MEKNVSVTQQDKISKGSASVNAKKKWGVHQIHKEK